jgi:hypothetical protein
VVVLALLAVVIPLVVRVMGVREFAQLLQDSVFFMLAAVAERHLAGQLVMVLV